MNFSSDNVSPICPEILEAIVAESQSDALPYGADDLSAKLDAAFSDLFGREVAVIPVSTGTAANCIAISGILSPFGGVVCHRDAHINQTESTGIAFFSGGGKLLELDGPAAKIEADNLDRHLVGLIDRPIHAVEAECVAITQTTEFGALYSVPEIETIGAVCRKHGMTLFMDGARFANAVAALGCHPADITWKAGVDVLAFGATKNGALAVDAIILFDTSNRKRIEKARKRAGHLYSKHRYLAAQLLAYLKDDVWLKNARHANQAAQTLEQVLSGLGGDIVHAPQGNELFIHLPAHLAEALAGQGVIFRPWPVLGQDIYRFVTAWNSDLAAIHDLARLPDA
jgi:threonine aldolase